MRINITCKPKRDKYEVLALLTYDCATKFVMCPSIITNRHVILRKSFNVTADALIDSSHRSSSFSNFQRKKTFLINCTLSLYRIVTKLLMITCSSIMDCLTLIVFLG